MTNETDTAETTRIPFDKPVVIRIGETTQRTVRTVNGACEVLIDWPHARRGPAYQSAREVVEAAIKGAATAAEAREAFLGLVKHAGVHASSEESGYVDLD